MVLVCASTSRKFHPGQVTETARVALIWSDSGIADVLIAVWPHSIGRRCVTGASKVAHCPETRPKAHCVASSWKGYACLDISTLEAHLVPRLDHAGPIIQVVVLESIEANVEGAVCCRYCVRVIPLEITGNTIPEINSGKVGIVTRIERPSVIAKLVRKHQLLSGAEDRLSGHGRVWSLRIYEASPDVL